MSVCAVIQNMTVSPACNFRPKTGSTEFLKRVLSHHHVRGDGAVRHQIRDRSTEHWEC